MGRPQWEAENVYKIKTEICNVDLNFRTTKEHAKKKLFLVNTKSNLP